MAGLLKPTKAEAAAMRRNEERYQSQLGYTIAVQSVLAGLDEPVGVREFAIRLHHKDHDELGLVLSAFDGFVDETLDNVRQAESRWWSSGFDALVLQALHAAAVSGVAEVSGRIAGRADKLVMLDPAQLSGGRLDVEKGSLTVDGGGVVEVFTRLCVAASAKTVPAGSPHAPVPAVTKPAVKMPPPTTGRKRERRDKLEDMAEALHAVLRKHPDYAEPMKVVGKQGGKEGGRHHV